MLPSSQPCAAKCTLSRRQRGAADAREPQAFALGGLLTKHVPVVAGLSALGTDAHLLAGLDRLGRDEHHSSRTSSGPARATGQISRRAFGEAECLAYTSGKLSHWNGDFSLAPSMTKDVLPGTSRTYCPHTCRRRGRRGPSYSQMSWPVRRGARAKRPRPQSHGLTKQKLPRGPNAAAVGVTRGGNGHVCRRLPCAAFIGRRRADALCHDACLR